MKHSASMGIKQKLHIVFFHAIFLLLLQACSCKKNDSPTAEEKNIQLLWMKTFSPVALLESAFNSTVVNNSIIVMPATYLRDGQTGYELRCEEDKRMVFRDIATGDIKGSFPAAYDANTLYNFEMANMYVSGNKIVCVSTNSPEHCQKEKALYCIDVSSGKKEWSINLGEWYPTKNIIGKGNMYLLTLWKDGISKIVKGDVLSGSLDTLGTIAANEPYSHVIYSEIPQFLAPQYSHQNTIVYVATLRHKNNFLWHNFIQTYDIDNKNIILNIPIVHNNGEMHEDGIRYQLVDTLLYAHGYNYMFCYNVLTGQKKWEWSVASFNVPDDIPRSFFVANGKVFLGGKVFYALDAATGKQLYAKTGILRDMGQGGTYAYDEKNNYLYYSHKGNGVVYVIEPSTGQVVYTIRSPINRENGEWFSLDCKPIIYEDKLFLYGYRAHYCYKTYKRK